MHFAFAQSLIRDCAKLSNVCNKSKLEIRCLSFYRKFIYGPFLTKNRMFCCISCFNIRKIIECINFIIKLFVHAYHKHSVISSGAQK